MSRSSYTLTADAFEALSAEARAEILAMLEPHESRGAAAGGAGGAAAPSTPPRGAPRSPVVPGAPQRLRRPATCELHAPLGEDGARPSLGYSQNSWGDYSTFAPLCSCPAPPPFLAGGAAAAAAGTPPGSPGPLRPPWRTGSCGESGPFIGLSYGWTCELARRMDRWPEVDAFDLKAQMFAEMAVEPDLLRDFTEQEVVDGMAHYSWRPERAREMLAALRARAAAEGAEEEVDAPPPLPEPAEPSYALAPAHNTSAWERMRAAEAELEEAIEGAREAELAAFEETVRYCADYLEPTNAVLARACERLGQLRALAEGESLEDEGGPSSCGCRGRYCGDCWPGGYQDDGRNGC